MFAAAFVAGAAAAVGLNRTLEVHLAQAKPQVEQEPIFVALRPLPQGSPVTVWDVALRDWPKAMLPSTAMRATDSFDGLVVKYPLREGQPVLSVQLAGAAPAATPAAPAATPASTDAYAAQPTPAVVPQVVPQVVAPATTSKPPNVMQQPQVVEPVRPTPADDSWTPAEQAAAPPQPAVKAMPSERIAALVEQPIARPPVETPGPAAPASGAKPSPQPKQGTPPSPVLRSTDIDLPAIGSPRATVTAAATTAAPKPKPKDPVVRYLVVPEHIAAQADVSFVTPPQPEVATTPRPSAAPGSTGASSDSGVHAGATKTGAAGTATSRPSVTVPGVPQAGGPRAAAAPAQSTPANRGLAATTQPHQRPRQPPPRQAAGRPVNDRSTTSDQAGSRGDPMFPNLAAGIAAVELEMRRFRRGRSAEHAAPTDRPVGGTASTQQPPNRSANRP